VSVMKVGLAHDYITQRGGAERVVLALMDQASDRAVHTALYAPQQTFKDFARLDVRTSGLQGVPLLQREPRLAAPAMNRAMRSFDLDSYDVVVCSTSGWAHAVTAQRKLAYCYTPARWLYEPDDYFRGNRASYLAVKPFLKRWRVNDEAAAHSVDCYIAISNVVADRIKRAYGIIAEVIPPPVLVNPEGEQQKVFDVESPFVLTVARPRNYKNTRCLVEAFRELRDLELVVVGSAASGESLPTNVRVVGRVTEPELRWLYANCSAVATAANEDFGLTPLEGNAFGKPAIALKAGGFLDTVVEGVTGVFFERPEASLVASAVKDALKADWSDRVLENHAASYSPDIFHDRIRSAIERTVSVA
jgi:glycosyltransferase involved in cell wall biosynthesis